MDIVVIQLNIASLLAIAVIIGVLIATFLKKKWMVTYGLILANIQRANGAADGARHLPALQRSLVPSRMGEGRILPLPRRELTGKGDL